MEIIFIFCKYTFVLGDLNPPQLVYLFFNKPCIVPTVFCTKMKQVYTRDEF